MIGLYEQGWRDGRSAAEAQIAELAKRVAIAERQAKAERDAAWLIQMFVSVGVVAVLFTFASHLLALGEKFVEVTR